MATSLLGLSAWKNGRTYYVPFAGKLVCWKGADAHANDRGDVAVHWFNLVLLVLASYRLTHLVVFDSITEPIRNRLAPVPFVGELVSCYWCAGVWVSAALLAGQHWFPAPTRVVVLIMAIAGGQALVETLSRKQE
jgi:hypothetical protein